MNLIQYRDMGMATYTYFYVDDDKHQVSPFFNSEKEALLSAFNRIKELDIFYIYSKNGYVGKTGAMEIAFAYALGNDWTEGIWGLEKNYKPKIVVHQL
jgi:hypothetical protein